MQLLTVNKLNKAFGGLKAVNNVNFEIARGEIVGLIGPNGSGKTTIINLLSGHLKPDSGSINFDGEEIAGFPRYRVCNCGLTRTFQINKPFLELTALQNVMVGRSFGRNSKNNLNQSAEESREFLAKVGLADYSERLSSELTLMQRKRLELARALATEPKLLFLDELMAGLNYVETAAVMDTIRQIRESGITIFIVEHIVKAVMGLSDRIIVLNMGQKIAEGTPQEIAHHPQVIDVYLGKSHASN